MNPMARPAASLLCLLLVAATSVLETQAQIQTLGSGNFVQDSSCGSTKICFSNCQAGLGCTYEAACSSTSDTAECTLTVLSTSAGDSWFALAFSSDMAMGEDSVTGCKKIGQTFSVFNAKNHPSDTVVYRSLTEISSDGVSLTDNEVKDSVLRCTFQRVVAAGINGDRFDLSQPWYWLFAMGPLNGQGAPQYHSATGRFPSSQQYDLTSSAAQGPGMQGPTTPPSGTSSDGNIMPDLGCGSTKTCFSDCSGGSCTYQLACEVSASNAQCALELKVVSGNVWVGWALSEDSGMGSDSVIGCKVIGNQVTAFNAENQAQAKLSTEYNLETEITYNSGQVNNGVFRCVLTRPLTPGQGSRLFDLSQPWYWFVATGNVAGQAISYHGTNKYISSQKFDLSAAPATQSPATQGPTTTPSLTGSLVKSSDCGSSTGCFTKCDSPSSCTFTVAWRLDAGSTTASYSLSSDVGSSGSWIAVGFSQDGNMGDDDVMGCLGLSDGSVRKFSAENRGNSPEIYTDNDLVLVSSSMEDGTLSCTLQRPVASYSVGEITRRDIDQPWTMFFARGSGSVQNNEVSISYHTANGRFRSNLPLSASQYVDDAAEDEDYPLIKLHGSLMIGAWVFLASLGIVAARYYKPVWKKDMCSLKVWFQIHRTCMILVFCTCVGGFVAIFVEAEEWIEIEEKPKYLEGHPIMGVIVTGLCVLNPLMALVRPHPGTQYRPIFNWAHWFVGTSAHILGVVTIFFGFELDKADAPDYLKYILAGYVCWQAAVELTLEMMACCCSKKKRSEVYKMADADGGLEAEDSEEDDNMDTVRKWIFLLHFFVVSSISAVLIALLVVGKKELDS